MSPVNISLNVSSFDELQKCIALLKSEGLLSGTPVTTAIQKATIPVAGKIEGRGGYAKQLSLQSAEYLKTLGLTESPKATSAELELRKVIDTERKDSNQKGIFWNADLVSRHEALLAKGHDIFNHAPSGDASSDEPSNDVVIDFNNPVV